MGPPIASRLAARTDAQLAKFIHDGSPTRGMPPMPVPDNEMPALLTFLRDLQHQAEEEAAVVQRLQVRTVGGATLDGEVVGKGFDDLQLRTDNHRVDCCDAMVISTSCRSSNPLPTTSPSSVAPEPCGPGAEDDHRLFFRLMLKAAKKLQKAGI